ncbi:site-2 protease family protein [Patescibacteria group bacterium]|nr:site-2 protease family protein [Patescibacteria group bacterium]
MFADFFTNPIGFFIAFGGLLLSLSFHEFAHAWVADHLGDPTPRAQGRVTLNPLAHLDPLGTIALLLVSFGWGKPVEIDPFNFRNPVRDSALVALAGPATNIVLAAILAAIVNLVPLPTFVLFAFAQIAVINIVLAIFNLIPVYPLDGSKIVLPLLPRPLGLEYEHFMHRYGMLLMIALLIPWANGVSPISALITPVIQFFARLLFS